VSSAFDELAARLDYPMFVVTAYDGTERGGCLVGFTTQCSIDPVRFLVCLSDKNHTFRVARGATTLAVHLFDGTQRPTVDLFGSETGDEVDKLARVSWRPGPDGVPVLDGAMAWFAGRIVDRVPFGDHVGHVLEPFDGEVRGAVAPVTFQAVRDLDPGHPA
jgi:flavin reductase (DIM6/NTAB) family NADH-FMN oxidoreductase RutF